MQFRNLVKIDLGEHKLSEFTDGEGATGTKTIDTTLPAGFFPLAFSLNVEEAATGDVSTGATVSVGVTGDADAYLAASSIFTVDKLRVGVPSDPDVGIDDDQSILLTATSVAASGAAFSDLEGGTMTLIAGGIFMGPEEEADS